jgi:hypothetical protein
MLWLFYISYNFVPVFRSEPNLINLDQDIELTNPETEEVVGFLRRGIIYHELNLRDYCKKGFSNTRRYKLLIDIEGWVKPGTVKRHVNAKYTALRAYQQKRE